MKVVRAFVVICLVLPVLLAPSSVAAQPSPPPTDVEVAQIAIQLAIGNLHTWSVEDGHLEVAAALDDRQARIIDDRVTELLGASLEKAGRWRRGGPVADATIMVETCLREQALRGAAAADAETVCARHRSTSSYLHVTDAGASLGARIYYVETLLDYVTDEDWKAKARLMLATRMGWQPVWFTSGRLRSFILVPTAPASWSPKVLAEALRFAAGDVATKRELEAAAKKASPYSCVWSPAGLERRDARAPARYDAKLTPRPDTAGSGGRIACADVAAIAKDKEAVAAVKRTLRGADAKAVLAVEAVAGEGWNTETLRGRPVRQTRIVRLYRRVPALPPGEMSLDEAAPLASAAPSLRPD